MNYHDSFREIESLLSDKRFVEKMSPKFDELSTDIQEIFKHGKDPATIAVMLFKLVEERQKTNSLLEKILEKFEEILKKADSASLDSQHQGSQLSTKTAVVVLPEQDQLILHTVHEKGQVTAEEIRKELGYKGNNAASQRLNKLYKEGHLRKIQSGRKVVYLARNN